MTTGVSNDPTKAAAPIPQASPAEKAPAKDGKPEQAADPKGAPATNSAALSGKPGGSQLQLPGATVTKKVTTTTTTTTTTVTEETTTTTGTGDTPPAGQPAGEKVPGYQDKFGDQSYVKDGSNKDMLDLAQKVVDKNPALKDSPLAQHIKDGKLSPEDVKALQSELKAKGFDVGSTGVDGKYGPKTHAALQQYLNGEQPPSAQTPATQTPGAQPPATQQPATQQPATQQPASDSDLEGKLKAAAEHSQYNESLHKCFKYAWDVTRQTGGKDINHATQSTDGRGQPITHLDQMIKDGKLKPGDVVYVNKKPGADPSSTNLAYGPHWFVYMGHGKFADQYHNRSTGGREKSAAEMQAFVRGRVIDTVYHTH